jgi:hypothetical protein
MPHYLKIVRRGHSNPRARRNMAVTFDGKTFTDMKELADYKKAKDAADFKPVTFDGIPFDNKTDLDNYKKVTGQMDAPRKGTAPKKGGGGKKYVHKARPAGTPVSYNQGKTIGCSVGGMAAYCPQFQGAGMTHGAALTELGLDFNTASQVMETLIAEGVKRGFPGRQPDEPEALLAQQILTKVGGVTCGVKSNPRQRRRRGMLLRY